MDANSSLSWGQADNINCREQKRTEWQGLDGRQHCYHERLGSGLPARLFLQFRSQCVHCDFNLRKILLLAFEIKISSLKNWNSNTYKQNICRTNAIQVRDKSSLPLIKCHAGISQ